MDKVAMCRAAVEVAEETLDRFRRELREAVGEQSGIVGHVLSYTTDGYGKVPRRLLVRCVDDDGTARGVLIRKDGSISTVTTKRHPRNAVDLGPLP